MKTQKYPMYRRTSIEGKVELGEFDIPDNSALAKRFRQNHPQVYKFQMRLEQASQDCSYQRLRR